MAIRKIWLLSLSAVAALFVLSASAALTPILPESSLYDGWTAFHIGDLFGRVDFAVYDTTNEQNGWFGAGFEAPGEGQYIYAYQVFSSPLSSSAIESFAVFDNEEDPLIVDETSIGSQDDSEGGIKPNYEAFISSNTRAIWEFEAGFFPATAHSWFLVFSSDSNWVPGSYDIQPVVSEELSVPGATTPEPATLTLFTLASLMMFVRRRRIIK